MQCAASSITSFATRQRTISSLYVCACVAFDIIHPRPLALFTSARGGNHVVIDGFRAG